MTNVINQPQLYWPRTNTTDRVIELTWSNGRVERIPPGGQMRILKQVEGLAAIRVYKLTLLYGGMGWGKSRWLRMALIDLLLEWGLAGHVGVRTGLFSETLKALRDRHVNEIQAEYGFMGTYNKNEMRFTLHDEYAAGFINLYNTDDPEKYKSIDMAACGIDELSLNRVKKLIDMLLKRLRWPNIAHTPMLCASNTTGIGAAEMKDMIIDHPRPTRVDRHGRKHYGFYSIHGTPLDNPTLEDEVVNEYESAEGAQHDAYFKGLFVLSEGAAFTLIPGIHTIEPLRPLPVPRNERGEEEPPWPNYGRSGIPREWVRCLAVDFGGENTNAAVALAQNPLNGRIICFACCSLYGKSAREMKAETYDYFAELGEPISMFDIIVGDESGDRGKNDNSADRDKTDWEIWNRDETVDTVLSQDPAMKLLLRPSFRMRRAVKDREAGFKAMREVYSCEYEIRSDENGTEYYHATRAPICQIVETEAAHVISSVGWMILDEGKGGRDVKRVKAIRKPGQGDDEYDAKRYAIMALYKGQYKMSKDAASTESINPRERGYHHRDEFRSAVKAAMRRKSSRGRGGKRGVTYG